MKQLEEKSFISPPVAGEVMNEIKRKEIQMHCQAFCIARKIFLESAFLFSILLGGFFVSAIFYLIKKAGILRFLTPESFDFYSFLINIPYGYLALFLLSLIASIYLYQINGLAYTNNLSKRYALVIFFIVSILLGLLFSFLGFGQIIKVLLER